MSRLTAFAEFMNAYESYALLGHINPDGDSIGSTAALALILEKMGKRVFVCLPGGIPGLYRNFPCSAAVIPDTNYPFEPEAVVSLDISDEKRMDINYALYMRSAHRAMLDHHETNPGDGDTVLIDGKAAATGELVTELIEEMGQELTREAAMWLYIAMCTDSGRFGFACTRPQTLRMTAKCLEAGIDVDKITTELYRVRSEGRTRLLGAALNRLTLSRDGKICCSFVDTADMASCRAQHDDKEGIVNYLAEIRGVEAGFLAEAQTDGSTKFSLRSKGDFDVAAICRELGGGGHINAAGVTLHEPLAKAMRTVYEAIEKKMSEREA